MDTILHVRKDGRREKHYKAICGNCGVDKEIYLPKRRMHSLCSRCVAARSSITKRGKPGPNKGKKFSAEIRDKMSQAKKGCVPWNKGITGVSEETSRKMSRRKQSVIPHNKGKHLTLEQRIKLSCVNRGISVDDFDDFTTETSKAERNKFADMKLHIECFKRDNFICDVCCAYAVAFNAHHLNSWKHFPEQRFDLNNLVTLCDICHAMFHKMFGNGKVEPNTKEQYLEFKEKFQVKSQTKKTIYILTGAPASGKSWVLSNLNNSNLTPLDSDAIPKKQLVNKIQETTNPLVAITVGVTTLIRHNARWDCKLIVIQESEEIIKERMIARGGIITNIIVKRINRMINLVPHAIFTGTSQEVLEFFNNLN